ncbi:MAG TPA: PDR/VanB family oxidoreductase [Paraburkholderia sp.]|jgi:vanillate O-demethylase ferredoxin subunit|nr:PDR/VanB family oxidoreductase [Paraburkholderia sp.]
MKVTVAKKHEVARGICAFELADPCGAPLPAFSAGAHIDVHLRDGLTRQYSLCNGPHEQHRYMIGVLLEPASRGGSAAMHALAEGATLEIGAPKNHFPLAHDATHSVLLAGGIGVTPILCMAERLAHGNASFEVHYCVRDAERAAFRERFAAPGLQPYSTLYFDSAPAAERIDLGKVLAAPSAGKHLYVCGPAGFIDAVLREAERRGWQSANVHREYFGAAPANTAQNTADGPFQVKLASSGRIVDVAAGVPVTRALSEAGVTIATSCEEGVCGTCLTRVLEGAPDHRDVYLTDAERAANDQFLPCCSRAKSPLLVLDL